MGFRTNPCACSAVLAAPPAAEVITIGIAASICPLSFFSSSMNSQPFMMGSMRSRRIRQGVATFLSITSPAFPSPATATR